MPEYLAPGVFIEEISFRSKTIEGVSTSTAAFVGPCRFGPINGEPSVLTGYAAFEAIYGGLDKLSFDGQASSHNYVAHAVRAFFEEGGLRLHVARIYLPIDGDDGIARWDSSSSLLDNSQANLINLRARYPGTAGNFSVTMTVNLGPSLLKFNRRGNTNLDEANTGDVVWAQTKKEANSTPSILGQLYEVQSHNGVLQLSESNDGGITNFVETDLLEKVRSISLTVKTSPMGHFGVMQVWDDLVFDPSHSNSLSRVFAKEPASRTKALTVPLVFESDAASGVEMAKALMQLGNIVDGSAVVLSLDSSNVSDRTTRLQLSGGNDGQQPTPEVYRGGRSGNGISNGLVAFEELDDISMVAAPGSTHNFAQDGGNTVFAESILREIIHHCEQMRYRVAVLDSIEGSTVNKVLKLRCTIDSSWAALYFPWVRILDPLTNQKIDNPPSGHICGIYARTDIERGVHKAPANEVIRLAIGLEKKVNKAKQEVLNPEGVNCLRKIRGRGYRVWGARTISSHPEWRYINVRRYFAYLEHSIDNGTQWAVFESNGEALWSNVRETVRSFLYNEWKSGALLGAKPEEAFSVRCDRTTMTQNDLDNGRMICQIGVAPLKPAEFVIFRIGQKTADADS
jgi:phage tail sheath protein FI